MILRGSQKRKAVLLTILMVAVPGGLLAQPLWTADGAGVAINQPHLQQLMAKSAHQFTLSVAGRQYGVQVDDVSQPNLGVTSLRGRIDDNADSFFLLCRTDGGATVAFFQPGDGSAYRLDHSQGFDAVYPIEYEKMGSCAGGLDPQSLGALEEVGNIHSATPRLQGRNSRAVADDGSRHDILIGYTPRAEEFMGGFDYIRAEAQLAVDAANLSYLNSNITSSLRLVHVMDTDYEESTAWDYEDHVEYLWYPADGRMDNVLAARESVGADFVSVLIDGRNSMGEVPTCGVAPIMQADQNNPSFQDKALSIVSVQCATGNWTLAHEVGHNRGCAHDRVNATHDGVYTYSYGLRFYYDPETDFGLRTIMAYNHPDGGYTRVPHFSNPDVDYAGHSTGIAPGLFNESHNALTQNNTSALSATWRVERTFVQFGWDDYSNGFILTPYATLADAAAVARDHGAIVLLNDNPNFTGTLAGPFEYRYEGEGSSVLGGD